jgi:hypothetical protein
MDRRSLLLSLINMPDAKAYKGNNFKMVFIDMEKEETICFSKNKNSTDWNLDKISKCKHTDKGIEYNMVYFNECV